MALKSVQSQPVDVTTLATPQVLPGVVTDIRAYNGEEGKIVLVWTAPQAVEGSADAAVKYEVGKIVGGALTEVTEVTELTHTLTVTPGTTIADFGIVSVDADGEKSTIAPVPSVDTKPSAPTITGESNAAGEVTLTVTIDKLAGKNTNVDAVEVFRNDGTPEVPNFVAVIGGETTGDADTGFVVKLTGLTPLTKYTYAAVAVHTAGVESLQ